MNEKVKGLKTRGFKSFCFFLIWRRVRDLNPGNLAVYRFSSYLRASFDEIIKVTLRYLEIPKTRMNQGFSDENHEFTAPRLDPRI